MLGGVNLRRVGKKRREGQGGGSQRIQGALETWRGGDENN